MYFLQKQQVSVFHQPLMVGSSALKFPAHSRIQPQTLTPQMQTPEMPVLLNPVSPEYSCMLIVSQHLMHIVYSPPSLRHLVLAIQELQNQLIVIRSQVKHK